MLDEGDADFLELRVEVMAFARQAEAALIGVESVDLAVFLVGLDQDPEESSGSPIVHGREHAREVGGRSDGGDPLEVGLDRLHPGCIDGRGVHRRFEKIADLLLDRAGLVRSRRGSFEDALESQLVELVELAESAPTRLVGRHRIACCVLLACAGGRERCSEGAGGWGQSHGSWRRGTPGIDGFESRLAFSSSRRFERRREQRLRRFAVDRG